VIVAEKTTKPTSDAGSAPTPAERRLLAGMPLHAITSVYGEAGLRERLLMEIAQFPPADLGRVQDALTLASRLHAADRRQREPYANHLLRVTIRILSHYRVADPDVACAALLHDAVEDHAADIAPGGRQAALAVPAGRFGARAAQLVAAVTNPRWEPDRDEHEQYREHVLASLGASPWARVIKASDFTDLGYLLNRSRSAVDNYRIRRSGRDLALPGRLCRQGADLRSSGYVNTPITDNAVGIIHTTGPKLPELASKYGPLVPALRELIMRPDTPLEADVKDMIASQLDAAHGRFAAIWHGRDGDSMPSQPPAVQPGSA
jgi:HD domain